MYVFFIDYPKAFVMVKHDKIFEIFMCTLNYFHNVYTLIYNETYSFNYDRKVYFLLIHLLKINTQVWRTNTIFQTHMLNISHIMLIKHPILKTNFCFGLQRQYCKHALSIFLKCINFQISILSYKLTSKSVEYHEKCKYMNIYCYPLFIQQENMKERNLRTFLFHWESKFIKNTQ